MNLLCKLTQSPPKNTSTPLFLKYCFQPMFSNCPMGGGLPFFSIASGYLLALSIDYFSGTLASCSECEVNLSVVCVAVISNIIAINDLT